jgi:hypothetical protein
MEVEEVRQSYPIHPIKLSKGTDGSQRKQTYGSGEVSTVIHE